ncbi:hypothetical protein [Pseudomonas sp. 24 E 13]|nr:hypothetical protein [Pseudomonas sp. 24 E 13]CRN01229.1 hypothetical protein [Pseudomonas sp. 34 E 7]
MHSGTRHQPVQTPIAIHIGQRLVHGPGAVGDRHAGQLQRRAVAHLVAGAWLLRSQRLMVIPAFVYVVQHTGQAFAIQVHQLITHAVMQPGQCTECLVAARIDLELARLVKALQRRAAHAIARAVVGLLMDRAQQADMAGGAVFQEQALDQHRVGAHSRFFGEVVKHQDLAATAQGA